MLPTTLISTSSHTKKMEARPSKVTMGKIITYDKRVLVTGGAGFIGSHFLDYFVRKYPHYHFTCIDKLNYVCNGSTKFMEKVLKCENFSFIQKDVYQDYDFLYDFLVTNYDTTKIDYIVNIAAESSVNLSFEDPLYFTKNNVIGTQNLLECWRILFQKNPTLKEKCLFLHVSTDEVYGEQAEGEHVDEKSPLNPTNPYSSTKAATDLILGAYRQSFRLPVAILRSNNVYGARQHPEKIIALALTKLVLHCCKGNLDQEMEDKIKIHGDGSNKRTYLHIVDLLEAIDLIWNILLKEPLSTSGKIEKYVFNIGSEDEIDNLSLVKLIITKFFEKKGKKSPIEFLNYIAFTTDRCYNDSRYSINYAKTKKLGWKPAVKLEQGLEEMIEELY